MLLKHTMRGKVMTKKILKHWALFYKNGERHFINAPTRQELDSAVFGGAYAPRFDSVTYYVEYERDIKDTQNHQDHTVYLNNNSI